MSSMITKITYFCSSQSRIINLYRMILIVVLGSLAYSNTLNTPFILDDTANIINNTVVKEFSVNSLNKAFNSRRAVGVISFQLNYFFTGEKVVAYHLTNIIIHLATAVMSYFLAALLMTTPYWIKNSPEKYRNLPIPFFVALIFVVHPVQTQAVTYIVQRYASLSTLFYITTVVCYLHARLLLDKKLARWIWFTVAGLSAFLACYTKEIAYTLPIIIMLIEFLFLRFSVKKLVGMTSILLISVLGLLLKLDFVKFPSEQFMSSLREATKLQTMTSRSDYLFTQFKVVVIYIKLLLFPVNQSLEYDIRLSHSIFEIKVLFSFLGLLTLFVLSFWLVQRSKEGNAHLRLIAFGIFWFFTTLSVESSFLPIIDLIFEHRVYLPSFGAITAIVTTVLYLFWKDGSDNKAAFICLTIVVFCLAGMTWKRNFVWKSEVSLWADTVAKAPKNARAWNNLGAAYIKQIEPLSSLKATIRSIELDPSKADAWNNLGIAIDLMGAYNERFQRTSEMFREPGSAEGKVVNRWLGDVNNNLGLAYEIIGNLKKAVESYSNAVGYDPSFGLAYYNLGIASVKLGDREKYSEQQQILWMIDPVLAERLQKRIGKR